MRMRMRMRMRMTMRMIIKLILKINIIMERDETDSITLEYLTNPLYHSGLMRTNKNEPVECVSKADVKFYRKRINSLSRELLRGGTCDDIFHKDVKDAHDEFVRVAINYLKMKDTADILQDEYTQADSDRNHDSVSQSTTITANQFDIGSANDMLFTKTETVPTLDNFVTSKVVKVVENKKHPQRRNVNLRSAELRHKGLRKKNKQKNPQTIVGSTE